MLFFSSTGLVTAGAVGGAGGGAGASNFLRRSLVPISISGVVGSTILLLTKSVKNARGGWVDGAFLPLSSFFLRMDFSTSCSCCLSFSLSCSLCWLRSCSFWLFLSSLCWKNSLWAFLSSFCWNSCSLLCSSSLSLALFNDSRLEIKD